MPIYEYKCDHCEAKFEKLVRASAPPTSLQCPSCGEERLSQQYSTFAARANGSAVESEAPSCGGGMCRMPGGCGMN